MFELSLGTRIKNCYRWSSKDRDEHGKFSEETPPNNHSTSYTPEQVVRIMSLWDTILVNKSFTDDLKRNLRIIKLTFPLIPPKGCHCIVERFMQNIRDPSQWTTIAHYYFLWGHTRVSLGILAKAFWRRADKTPRLILCLRSYCA
jgi:hypothetical protein